MLGRDKELKISGDGGISGENILRSKIVEHIDANKARITVPLGGDEDRDNVIELGEPGSGVHLKLSSDK